MAEIINLKRARKAKARAAAEEKAAGNRTTFGTPKKLRDLARTEREKDTHKVDVHRLNDDDKES
jgi:hypothetical protein